MPAGPARCPSSTICEANSAGRTMPSTPSLKVCSARSRCRDRSKAQPSARSIPTPDAPRLWTTRILSWPRRLRAGSRSAMRKQQPGPARITHLRIAMMSRALIEQAKGIVMERHKVTAAEASTILTRASQRTNTKLQDVAAELVRTGVLRVPVDAQSYRPSGRKVSL